MLVGFYCKIFDLQFYSFSSLKRVILSKAHNLESIKTCITISLHCMLITNIVVFQPCVQITSFQRSVQSIQERGENVQGFWQSDATTIAITVSIFFFFQLGAQANLYALLTVLFICMHITSIFCVYNLINFWSSSSAYTYTQYFAK